MRSTIISLPVTVFAAALAFGTVPAVAQTAPAATPKPATTPKPAATVAPTPTPSPAATPTPFKLITLSGSADGGITWVGGSDQARFTTGVPSRVFDGSKGAFFDGNGGQQLANASDFVGAPTLQNANLSINVNGSTFSGKFEGTFGSDSDVIASNGQARDGLNITQAYVQGTGGPITGIAGKFETLAGAEYIEAPLNTNYSRSYLFGYAIPFTHTGARITYVINPKFTVVGGVNNGWDDVKFAGKKKTIEGALLMTLSPGVTWNIQTYNGNDFAVGGNSAAGFSPVFTNRMLYDSELTLHVTPAFTLIGNYDNGTQLADDGSFFPTAAHWNGFAGYANYQFTPMYGISLRKESFHDVNGFRTSVAQRLQSNTATLNYTPSSNLIFRGEIRLDTTDANDFTYRGYVPNFGFDESAGPFYPNDGRPHQASFGLEAIVKFP